MSITLHYFPLSTTSQKVRLCLFHKGIEVAEQIVDLIKLDQLRPEYLALNPNGQVPTLVVDGQPLYESSIINEFLEELKPQPALLPPPEDRVRRARIRMWTKYIDTGPTIQIASPTYRAWVAPALAQLPTAEVQAQVERAPDETTRKRWLRTLHNQIDDAEVSAAYNALRLMLQRMEALLADQPWLFGDSVSLADLETLPIVVRLVHLGRAELFADLPRVSAWFAQAQSLPAAQAVYGPLTPPAA